VTLDLLGLDGAGLSVQPRFEDPVQAIPFEGAPPREAPLAGLLPGASYRLAFTLTNGNTPPTRAEAPFHYQGEAVLRLTSPPRAVPIAPPQVECEGPYGAMVELDGSASQDPDSTPGTSDDISLYEWIEDLGLPTERLLGARATLAATLSLGRHAIWLRVTDFSGASDAGSLEVVVSDTARPQLQVFADPQALWPPNHHLVPVTVAWDAPDACDPAPRVELVAALSSEPDDAGGAGDGDTTGDVAGAELGTPDTEILLRAERAGERTGRAYELRYRATDMSGNGVERAATVTVPHSLGSEDDAVRLDVEDAQPQGGVLLRWSELEDATGYDVIEADLRQIRVEGSVLLLGDVRVLARDTDLLSIIESTPVGLPAPGSALIYLVQPRTARGGLGYGEATAPRPREPRSCDGGCP